MKDIITIVLILGGCLVIGDRPGSIALAAGMIVLAGIVQRSRRKA